MKLIGTQIIVVMLHETVHELHRKELNKVILKSTLKTPTIKSSGPFFHIFSVGMGSRQIGASGYEVRLWW